MEIHLSEELERYVEEQVKAGRFSTRDQVVSEALEQFKHADAAGRDPLLGFFSDEPELMDEIVEAAMHDRESRSLRLPADG